MPSRNQRPKVNRNETSEEEINERAAASLAQAAVAATEGGEYA